MKEEKEYPRISGRPGRSGTPLTPYENNGEIGRTIFNKLLDNYNELKKENEMLKKEIIKFQEEGEWIVITHPFDYEPSCYVYQSYEGALSRYNNFKEFENDIIVAKLIDIKENNK